MVRSLSRWQTSAYRAIISDPALLPAMGYDVYWVLDDGSQVPLSLTLHRQTCANER